MQGARPSGRAGVPRSTSSIWAVRDAADARRSGAAAGAWWKMRAKRRLSPQERALVACLGLAVGDALGAAVELKTPMEIRARYGVHREMVGGGFRLQIDH